jgi:uncharacterized protein YidB (DUF937 family)
MATSSLTCFSTTLTDAACRISTISGDAIQFKLGLRPMTAARLTVSGCTFVIIESIIGLGEGRKLAPGVKQFVFIPEEAFVMSLLDQLVGQVLGQPQTTTGTSSGGGLGGVLMQLLGGQGTAPGQGGGLSGLIDQFRTAGLGHVADSWVGSGTNQPVSPQQLQTVFGDEQVQNLSRQSGMAPQDFLSQLSQHLPRVVDGMTPGGRLPDEGTVSV